MRLTPVSPWIDNVGDAADAGQVLLEVSYSERTPISERLGAVLEGAVSRGVQRALERLESPGEWLR